MSVHDCLVYNYSLLSSGSLYNSLNLILLYSNPPASPPDRGYSNVNDSVALTPSNDSFDSLWMEDGFEYDITYTGKIRRQLYRILCICIDYIKSWTTSYCL